MRRPYPWLIATLALSMLLSEPGQSASPQDSYAALREAEAFLNGDDRDRSRVHVRRLRERLRTVRLYEVSDGVGSETTVQVHRDLARLGALEGDFSGALEDYRWAEQAVAGGGTIALDMRRGQATILALTGRFEEAAALDEETPFCTPGGSCSLTTTLEACRATLRRIRENRAVWSVAFEGLGPQSSCAAWTALEIALLSEAQGRDDLVEPFLGLAIFASQRSRFGAREAGAEVRRLAGDALIRRWLGEGRLDDASGLMARLEGMGGENEARSWSLRRDALLRPQTPRRADEIGEADANIRAALATNIATFGQVTQGVAYQDSAVSRPFQGAETLFEIARTISKQHLQLRELDQAEEFSDLALHFASRAIAPHGALRADFGSASPQCPPGRRESPECRAWETDSISAYSSLEIAGVLAERADLEAAKGDWESAVTVTGYSELVLINWLQQNWTSARGVADQFRRQQAQDIRTIRLLDVARRGAPHLNDLAAKRAFEIAQRFQFGEIDAGVRDARIRRRIDDPRIARIWQVRQDLARELGSLERGSSEFARTSAELARADASLGFSPSELEQSTAFRLSSFNAVQQRLSDDEVLLLIAPGEDRTDVFLATTHGLTWHVSPRSEIWIADHVDRLREHLNATGGARRGYPRSSAFALYDELIAPLAAEIGGRRILLSASGSVDRLPLAALVTQRPAGSDLDPQALRATAWLGFQNSVVVVPSLSILEDRAIARRARLGGLVAFANPTLPQADLTDVEERNGVALGRLVGAEREVAALQRTLRGPALVFKGEEATEGALRRADLRDLNVLAFATHGLSAGQWRPDSEPGLLFTPGVAGESNDDGFLSASEAAELEIGADLILLSACDTASARMRGGASLTGLALSFLFAGGQTVVATHWPVADEAASQLVAGSVGRAGSLSATELAEAVKTEMRLLARSDPDPRYWAPFIVIGA